MKKFGIPILTMFLLFGLSSLMSKTCGSDPKINGIRVSEIKRQQELKGEYLTYIKDANVLREYFRQYGISITSPKIFIDNLEAKNLHYHYDELFDKNKNELNWEILRNANFVLSDVKINGVIIRELSPSTYVEPSSLKSVEMAEVSEGSNVDLLLIARGSDIAPNPALNDIETVDPLASIANPFDTVLEELRKIKPDLVYSDIVNPDGTYNMNLLNEAGCILEEREINGNVKKIITINKN